MKETLSILIQEVKKELVDGNNKDASRMRKDNLPVILSNLMKELHQERERGVSLSQQLQSLKHTFDVDTKSIVDPNKVHTEDAVSFTDRQDMVLKLQQTQSDTRKLKQDIANLEKQLEFEKKETIFMQQKVIEKDRQQGPGIRTFFSAMKRIQETEATTDAGGDGKSNDAGKDQDSQEVIQVSDSNDSQEEEPFQTADDESDDSRNVNLHGHSNETGFDLGDFMF